MKIFPHTPEPLSFHIPKFPFTSPTEQNSKPNLSPLGSLQQKSDYRINERWHVHRHVWQILAAQFVSITCQLFCLHRATVRKEKSYIYIFYINFFLLLNFEIFHKMIKKKKRKNKKPIT